MRLPYQKFLLYLLITRHTDMEVMNILNSFGLPKIGTLYLETLRESEIYQEASPELQKFLLSKNDSLIKLNRPDVSKKWVSEFGLLDAHIGANEYVNAYNIFSNRSTRDYANLYLLCSDMEHDRLCNQFEDRFGNSVTAEGIRVYREYFFDTGDMTEMDWQSYLSKFPPKLRLLYECAPNRHSRYIQWKLGDSVDITPADIATQLNIDFYFLSRESHIERKEGWEEVAPKFANVSLGAGDRVSRSKKSTEDEYNRDMIELVESQEEFSDFDSLYHGEDDE
jgi:hypothetical protein